MSKIYNKMMYIIPYFIDKYSLKYDIIVMAIYFVLLLLVMLLMLLLYNYKNYKVFGEIFLRFLITISVSVIVFSFTGVVVNQSYILIIISIIYVLYSSLKWRRNAFEFHCEYLPIMLGIQYAYFINKISIIDFEIICKYKSINTGSISLFLIFIGILINKIINKTYIKYVVVKSDVRYIDIEEAELFKSRNENLSLIEKYIKNDCIYGIGIEAEFGKGKSFLIKKIINDNNDRYFITIELLTCSIGKTEEIIRFLLNKFENIFIKHGIYSSSFKIIEKLICHFDVLFDFDYSFTDETITDTFEKLRNDIILSGIKFAVIVDDVDRVANSNILIKVFNILERIQSNNCKIIYLYNPEKLLNNHDANIISYDYIEKYISYRIPLSQITFEDLTEMIRLYKEKEIISENVFSFCSNALMEMRDNCYNWVYNTYEARRTNSNYITFFNKITPRNFQCLVFSFSILYDSERFSNEEKRKNLFKYLFVKQYMPNVINVLNKSSHVYFDLNLMAKDVNGNIVWNEFKNIDKEILSTVCLFGFSPYVYFRPGTKVYFKSQLQGIELSKQDFIKANNNNFNILKNFCNIGV